MKKLVIGLGLALALWSVWLGHTQRRWESYATSFKAPVVHLQPIARPHS
jgi:hypothetical protein